MNRRPPRSTRTDTLFPYTTLFRSIESRLELVQTKQDGWEGAIGAQMLMRDFRIVGEEKFLPKNETRQLSLFTLQSIDLGKLRAEAGARIEHSIVNADADPDIGNLATSRSFDAISGSIGASYAVADGWRLGFNGCYRSEERRVGKACDTPVRSRGLPYH